MHRPPAAALVAALAILLLSVAVSAPARAADARDGAAAAAPGSEEARLLRQPDLGSDRIVFVYGGDLWSVPRTGGLARRLTSDDGLEQFPKISPDGRSVAFTGQYDGNTDAFVLPIDGGEPRRLTWHPYADFVAEWYPDGSAILIRSARISAPTGVPRFFRVPAAGGFEEPIPLGTASWASINGDGTRVAYVNPSYETRTWKRYQGGLAPDIWIADLDGKASERMTDWKGADEWPMWIGDTIYYTSDRGGRTANLWAYDVKTKQHRQVTTFTDYDVKWPSAGPGGIVFENGGSLYVMDLPGEKPVKVSIQVPSDKPGTRAELRNVAKWTESFDLSPSAKRAVIAARGDLFTVPAEHGDVRNLTSSPGVRERDPAWSPDGKWIAYLSDRTGEYELYVRPGDGSGAERQVTKGGAMFRFAPRWSPDSKKLAFADKSYTLRWCDVASGTIHDVDKSEAPDMTDFGWSGDSRWIAYTWPAANGPRQVRLYSLDSGKVTRVSDGMSDDSSPAFDPDGRYLYFVSARTFEPEFGATEFDFHYTATNKLYAATLRDTLASPVAPRSDEESAEAKDGDKAGGGDAGDKGDGGGKAAKKNKGGKGAKGAADEGVKPWVVNLEGLGTRVAELPVPAGRYAGLTAFSDRVLFLSFDGPIADDEGPPEATLQSYSLEDREVKTVIEGILPGYGASKDGKKVLYRADEQMGIVDTDKENKPGDGKIESGTLMTVVDPKAEWRQMFDEAWRLERDFYYDPGMGGLDWKAIGERYRALLPGVAHRSDMNYILGELQGELSTSHTYVGGGDLPQPPQTKVGLLGVDWSLDKGSGRYRFDRIYRERNWNSDKSAPLGEPGIAVREGDLLLSVNGHDVRAPENVFAAFVGTAGRQTRITVGRSADDRNARSYTVVPIDNEGELRYAAWVRANRERVDKETGGKVAYVHVPNTATQGVQEFTKQYYPQLEKTGIIVDDRFNGGGFVPDFFVERLMRKTWVYWSTREGKDQRTPAASIDGPKVMLINQYAGSGGDAFPFYFRQQGVGPLIGKRTWGGLVGISRNLPLVDGGVVTIPDFGMWSTDGKWIVENHGVDPDIEVENPPHLTGRGEDPQLTRAIQYVNEELKKNPVTRPARPPYKVQEGLGR